MNSQCAMCHKSDFSPDRVEENLSGKSAKELFEELGRTPIIENDYPVFWRDTIYCETCYNKYRKSILESFIENEQRNTPVKG